MCLYMICIHICIRNFCILCVFSVTCNTPRTRRAERPSSPTRRASRAATAGARGTQDQHSELQRNSLNWRALVAICVSVCIDPYTYVYIYNCTCVYTWELHSGKKNCLNRLPAPEYTFRRKVQHGAGFRQFTLFSGVFMGRVWFKFSPGQF